MNCFEVGLVVLASGLVSTQDASLVDVLPGVFATEHIVDLLALQVQLVLELLLDAEHVGTRLAEESEVGGRLLSQ